jgi:hypothetical protein
MRVSEEPVCMFLFRQNLVFTSLAFEISRSCRTAYGHTPAATPCDMCDTLCQTVKNRSLSFNPGRPHLAALSRSILVRHAPPECASTTTASAAMHINARRLAPGSQNCSDGRPRFAGINQGPSQGQQDQCLLPRQHRCRRQFAALLQLTLQPFRTVYNQCQR